MINAGTEYAAPSRTPNTVRRYKTDRWALPAEEATS